MNIRDYSSQFTIYLFTQNVDQGASAKVYLSQAGYDAYFFQDANVLEERLRENPPHILVFSTVALQGTLSEFVPHVQAINDDIKFIALADPAQFEVLAQYNSHGFMDLVSDQGAAFESRVVWAVDRACEKLYQTYQNEQLYDDLLLARKQVEEAHAAAVATIEQVQKEKEEQSRAEAVVAIAPPQVPEVKRSTPSWAMRIADYKSSHSKEELIQKFLNNLNDIPCLYFKFLPSVKSFVATHASGFDTSAIQGVGCQLNLDEMKDLNSQLSMGSLPSRFAQMLKEAFHLEAPKVLPIFTQSLEGVLIHSPRLEPEDAKTLNEEFSLFSLSFTCLHLEKKVDALEVQDYVTEVYNRSYYFKVLNDEIERSRRVLQPVAVVKVAMDDFYEIESSFGEATRDELLRALAAAIAKTSRSNDVTCRTGMNEFAMILPHCSKKGAALRAERLRRIIESTLSLDNGLRLTVSLGISEFPTLCDSTKSLDESASKALSHISDKGGNKICLYKAPDNYQPEFEITIE